jgi:hypothetical protein
MKTILLILSLFIVNLVNSQVIKIEVSEVMDTYTYDTNVVNLLNDKNLIFESREVNGYYNIDLTHKTFIHVKDNVVESEGEITYEINDGIILVNFLVGESNFGLVINPDINNEQVTWFSVSNEYIELSKFTNFLIVKGS